MHTVSRSRLFSILGRTAAVTFFTAASTLALHAQQSAGTAPSLPAVSLKSTLAAPLDLSTPDDLKYSSSTGSAELAAVESFDLSGSADQPPPRRKYSRPNYNDSRTNSDGSAKYTFFVGGGFTLPVGGTHNYLATSYDVQAGAGRNFNKTFGVNVQFDWANFGFQTATLNNLLAIYNAPPLYADFNQLGGTSHDLPSPLAPSPTSTARTPSVRTSSAELVFITRPQTSRFLRLANIAARSTDATPTRRTRPSTNTPATPSA